MIKHIIFDVGGVLKIDSSKDIARYVCSRLGISIKKYHTITSQIFSELNKGKITEIQFWKLFLKNSNLKMNIESIKNLWKEAHEKNFKINEHVFNTAKTLKNSGYQIAILSNATKSNVSVNIKSKLYSIFPVCVLSSSVGLTKPDPKIYTLTLKKIKAKPSESLFIDDKVININAAKKLGIKTILFKNADQLNKELKKLI